ncbi:hypothetical protein RRG08_052761 [Elysia crispata]|uniref:Major facilitator superfamily (MFS) profile domain-containing protein n=1 Tax=Elysia crispata TaxID=231223 RepID=A0AAE1B7G8_9GAST|nr:hypothetical protein RRG08_052761 [Elysia crispata]
MKLDTSDTNLSAKNLANPKVFFSRHVLEDIAWSSDTKGLVLSAPLMLSFIGPVISDVIMRKAGSRYMYTFAQLFNAVIMFASPSLARASPYILLASHIVLGLTINFNFPIIATLLTRWTPLKQKLTVVSLVFTGPTLGSLITSLLNGYLCAIPVDNGWPCLFYAAGFMHVLFALAWFIFIGDYPETHRFISERERDYIVSRRPNLSNADQNQKAQRPPYKAMLTSVPVLSFVFVFVCFVWTIQLTIVYTPIYLNAVLGFTPEQTKFSFPQ